MANFLDKFKVNTAIDSNIDQDLSCVHVTTTDWMNGAPVYFKEMVPGEKIEVVQETFTRLDPLVVPTFGRGLVHNRAFFVPMRTIMKNWNDFITAANSSAQIDETAATGVSTVVSVNKVPVVKNSDFVQLFCGSTPGSSSSALATLVIPGSGYNEKVHDIVLVTYSGSYSNPVNTAYDLTPVGRRVMKILQSLGYNILWVNDVQQTPVDVVANESEYSALPILAWLKVICDWYYPSQYVGDSYYNYAQSLINAGNTSSISLNLTASMLTYLFSSNSPFSGLVNYDSDYFVSAFDNPIGASQGTMQGTQTGNIMFTDINYKNVGGVDGSANTPFGAIGVVNTTSSTNGDVPVYSPRNGINVTSSKQITQYGLDALKALTDYMKRHQLVGARALDRFYARFGKALSSEKMDRSNYIGSGNLPLQIGDVMSHADSQGAVLGQYAGKGVGFGNFKFDYSTDEYGYVIVVNSIVPQIGYYEGIDRTVMHVGRTDFWTPEFDQIGNQAIATKELLVPMNWHDTAASTANQIVNADLNDGIFGYTPRYSEYKIGRDKLTGDFRYNSKNKLGNTSDAWHMFRKVAGLYTQANDIKHSFDFSVGYDWNQYNRIFNYTNVDADKFYMIHSFGVHCSSPMHSLYDTYKFENDGEAKKVVADVNGVKVN